MAMLYARLRSWSTPPTRRRARRPRPMNAAPASRDAGPPDASGRDADGQDIDGQDIDGQDIDGQDALARAACLPIWSGPVDPQPLGRRHHQHQLHRGRSRPPRCRADRRRHPDPPDHALPTSSPPAAPPSRGGHLARGDPCRARRAGARLRRGRTFGAEPTSATPPTTSALVDLVRRCHREIPRHLRGPAAIFWVFQVAARLCPHARGRRQPPPTRLPPLLARGRGAGAAVGPVEIVFGHNDLLARQLHRRRPAALAGRLGLCRLQLAAVRPRRPRLQRAS